MTYKDLIKKFLNSETNDAETHEVNLFLQQPEAQAVFNEAWDEMEPEMKATAPTPDVESLLLRQWKKEIHKRIAAEDNSSIAKPRKPGYLRYAMAAAILLLLTLGGYGIFNTFYNGQNTEIAMTVANPTGKNMLIVLPDNSKVWLGPGSTLDHPKRFDDDTRELSLSGEAFFDVTKDPDKPFIIRTGDIYTKVLGTSFKIEAFEGGAPIVAVSTGKVRVAREHDGEMKELAILAPGEQVTWDPRQKKAVKTAVDKTEVLEWKDGKQVFNDVPLQDITKVLQRWYGMEITISDPGLRQMRLYTSLTNGMPIEDIMEVLAATGSFQYEIKGKTINIHKKI
ncbi:FecR family protein [Flavobacterium sp.]|uniref:FecR family protein n=1 Tax=Flavobacterium sp. TaxID=239 RepID=UPI004033C6CC